MPSSIKLTEPLEILVEYGYLDEDKPYHKALNNAVMDFAEDPSLGGEYNKDYVMLLQNEAKKELKLRRKKINVSKLLGRGEKKTQPDTTGTSSLAVRSKTGKIDTKKFIPEPTDENQEGGASGTVKDILSSVISIEETLNSQYQLQLEGAKEQKEETEKKRRGLREKMLEGSGKIWDGIKEAGNKIIEPFKNIWDKILGFISTIFFGRVFYKILEWMGNPDNQGKIESIIKFLKDWWPTLLTAYLLFGNSFGRMAVKLGVTVAKFATKLIKILIPKLLTGLSKLKAGSLLKGGLVAGAVVGTTYLAGKMMGKDKEGENLAEAQNQSREAIVDEGNMDEGEADVLSQSVTTENINRMTQGDTNIRSTTNMLQTGMDDPLGGGRFGLNKGGQVPGSGNTDTVPAMLTPGEFVMSKGAVQKYGVDTLEGLNAAAGGSNRPTLMGGYNEGEDGMDGLDGADGLQGLPGLGGGGGGTDAITAKATTKSLGTKTKDIGNLLARPFRSKKEDPRSMFASGGGGLVQGFQGGGQVRQMGRGASNSRIKLAAQQKKMNTPGTSSGKKTTVAYQDQGGSMKSAGGTRQPGNKEIPSFSAIAKRSPEKIRVLGISV